jgi:hypothetical protein
MYDTAGPGRLTRLPGRTQNDIDAILKGNAERAFARAGEGVRSSALA